MSSHDNLVSRRSYEELSGLPEPAQHSVRPIREWYCPSGEWGFPSGDENVPLTQVDVFAVSLEDFPWPHTRFHDDGRDIPQKRIGVLRVDALFRKRHDPHTARPFGKELDMELADGVAHPRAPVSERPETSKITVNSGRTALAGTDRFESFDSLRIHVFNPCRSEMSDEAFSGNAVSLVRSWFDVVTCPGQESVKGNVKSQFFSRSIGSFRISEEFYALGCFQP